MESIDDRVDKLSSKPYTKTGRFSSESGALKTRKEDGNLHGLGIKNIQDTVNKYNGWLKNSYDDHTFISEVLLCVSTV